MKYSNDIVDIPGILCVKNTDCRIIAITDDAAKVFGWKNADSCIGAIDYDIPCKASEMADEYIKLDQLSITQGKKIISVEVQKNQLGWRAFLCERTPSFNDKNAVVKLYISAIDITHTKLGEGLLLLSDSDNFQNKINKQINFIINSGQKLLPLTKKQELCLFLLVRGKVAKEIASIMGISIKTVESHLELIKAKLNCYSKSQLIEKAMDSGFSHYIPDGAFDYLRSIS